MQTTKIKESRPSSLKSSTKKEQVKKNIQKEEKIVAYKLQATKLQTCHRDYQAGYRSTSMCIRVVTVISRSSFIP
jgi:hypothetical protein